MEPIAIIQLALSLGVVVVPIAIGLTGAFKKSLPNTNPQWFSLPAGAVLSALAWFATQAPPSDLMTASAFALVVIIGALLPSGLFDAGVNVARKAIKDSGGMTKSITNVNNIAERNFAREEMPQ